MSTTYTISYGRASDCHAGRCRDIPVSRRERSVLVVGRSMEYEKPMTHDDAVELVKAFARMLYTLTDGVDKGSTDQATVAQRNVYIKNCNRCGGTGMLASRDENGAAIAEQCDCVTYNFTDTREPGQEL